MSYDSKDTESHSKQDGVSSSLALWQNQSEKVYFRPQEKPFDKIEYKGNPYDAVKNPFRDKPLFPSYFDDRDFDKARIESSFENNIDVVRLAFDAFKHFRLGAKSRSNNYALTKMKNYRESIKESGFCPLCFCIVKGKKAIIEHLVTSDMDIKSDAQTLEELQADIKTVANHFRKDAKAKQRRIKVSRQDFRFSQTHFYYKDSYLTEYRRGQEVTYLDFHNPLTKVIICENGELYRSFVKIENGEAIPTPPSTIISLFEFLSQAEFNCLAKGYLTKDIFRIIGNICKC